MAIDNEYDATDKAYPEPDDDTITALAKFFDGKTALIPRVGPFLAIFFKFLTNKSARAKQERGWAFIKLLIKDMQDHEKEIAKPPLSEGECKRAFRQAHKDKFVKLSYRTMADTLEITPSEAEVITRMLYQNVRAGDKRFFPAATKFGDVQPTTTPSRLARCRNWLSDWKPITVRPKARLTPPKQFRNVPPWEENL